MAPQMHMAAQIGTQQIGTQKKASAILLSIFAWVSIIACSGSHSPSTADANVVTDTGVEDSQVQDLAVLDANTLATSLLIVADDTNFAVLDIRNPSAPRALATVPAYDDPRPLLSLATDNRNQLFVGRAENVDVYRWSNGSLYLENIIETSFPGTGLRSAHDLVIDGSRLYIALGSHGVDILDITDTRRTRVLGHIAAEVSIEDIELLDRGHLVTYDREDSGLTIFDVSDAARIETVHASITDLVGTQSLSLAVDNGFAIANVSDGTVNRTSRSSIVAWDLRDLEHVDFYGWPVTRLGGDATSVSIWKPGTYAYAYFADRERGVVVTPIVDFSNAPPSHATTTAGAAWATLVHNNHLYVAQGTSGVAAYELNARVPDAPTLRATVALNMSAEHLSLMQVTSR